MLPADRTMRPLHVLYGETRPPWMASISQIRATSCFLCCAVLPGLAEPSLRLHLDLDLDLDLDLVVARALPKQAKKTKTKTKLCIKLHYRPLEPESSSTQPSSGEERNKETNQTNKQPKTSATGRREKTAAAHRLGKATAGQTAGRHHRRGGWLAKL